MIKINIKNLQAFLPSDFWKKIIVENLEKNLNGLLKVNGRQIRDILSGKHYSRVQ